MHSMNRKKRVLLGVSGSVAAIKGPELCLRLMEQGFEVKVVLTSGGSNFWHKANEYNGEAWLKLQEAKEKNLLIIHSPVDEWQRWNCMGDPVLHIELRDWADMIVIAPLSAHTLAKIATGLCDDTLTSVMRAWDFGHVASRPPKPIVLAPAMNTAMWEHPLTKQQLQSIMEFAPCDLVNVVSPTVKTLACGEVGIGALAPLEDILGAVCDIFSSKDAYA